MPTQVHVIGASGRSGAALCRALESEGRGLVPVVRNASRWVETGVTGEPRVADLADADDVRAALSDATLIASCVHARYAPAILAAAPPGATFVFLGSTRKFTRWPDDHARGVLVGEAAFLASNRPGVMLHPTMIYGAAGEDNVQRLASLLKRLPIVPLPAAGRALVQPIHQSDVTNALLAALDHRWTAPTSLVIAGPAALPYAAFVQAIARAAGLPPPRIVNAPAALLMAAAALTRLPVVPTIQRDEIRRLLEDKAFDTAAMRATLGLEPMDIETGLALMFDTDPRCV